jgi:hypothetical protein
LHTWSTRCKSALQVPCTITCLTLLQTGKTHTLVELIFQLLARPGNSATTLPPRILVCTPSNLALDNILLRLHALARLPPYSQLLPKNSILRLGHPTRVHQDLVQETLDYRAANGDEGDLLKDVGIELQGHIADLSKKRSEKGAIKGRERGKRWDEVRELRKESAQPSAQPIRNANRPKVSATGSQSGDKRDQFSQSKSSSIAMHSAADTVTRLFSPHAIVLALSRSTTYSLTCV